MKTYKKLVIWGLPFFFFACIWFSGNLCFVNADQEDSSKDIEEIQDLFKKAEEHKRKTGKEDEEYHTLMMKAAEEYQKYSLRLAEAGKVNFILKGSIVDENGNPLDGVLVEIGKTIYTGFGKYNETKEKMIVNEKIDLIIQKQHSIRLEFKKDGYYEENIDIVSHSKEYRGKIINNEILVNNLKITLKKIGQIADLTKFDANLKFNPNGNAQILDFSKSKSKASMEVGSVSDAKSLPENCVYVLADQNDTGKIMTELFNNDCYYPKSFRLIMNDPQGGFILFTPKEANVYREMKTAPESGYQKELYLRIEDYSKLFNGNNIYFYFSALGKYGKGRIISIEYREKDGGVFREGKDNLDKKDDGVLSVRVEFRINRDGSRNLETKN